MATDSSQPPSDSDPSADAERGQPSEGSDQGVNADATRKTANGGEGLLRASGVTGGMTLLSRLLGLARDIIIARLFGASDAADAFFLANKFPNFMRRLFAEGAFNQAFVPVLSEYRTTRSLQEVRGLIAAVAASLGGFLLLLTAVVLVAAPYVAVPLAYGFVDEPAKFALFVDMLRITFPYLLLISLTALCSAVLNSYGHFAVPAFTPVLLNVCLIGSALLLSPYLAVPELALAWGVLLAGVAQLLFQLPLLARMQLLALPKRQPAHPGLAQVKRLMLPGLFGVSISQINQLLDMIIASLLVSGSVTWLYFSDRLMELPLGVFGIALGIVVLPSLSRRHAESSMDAFASTLNWALRIVLLLAIPASLALVTIAEPLILTLFGSENFPLEDVQQSAASLRAYAVGLLGFMAIKIFAPGYYARQDTATPVRIGVIAMVTNMALNLLFYLAGLAHVGLALATSIAALLNATLLFRGLRRAGVFELEPGWLLFIGRLLIANAVMVLVLVAMSGDWSSWLGQDVWLRAGDLGVLVLAGLGAYLAVLLLLGLRPRQFYR